MVAGSVNTHSASRDRDERPGYDQLTFGKPFCSRPLQILLSACLSSIGSARNKHVPQGVEPDRKLTGDENEH